jgi:hypothetical protein
MRFDLASRKIHAALAEIAGMVSATDDKLSFYHSLLFTSIREAVSDMSIEAEIYKSEFIELQAAVVAGRMDEALSIARDRGLFEVVLTCEDAVAGPRA